MRRKLRTLLILGRVSNLPTVWSNCLAGWLLGGGGRIGELLTLGFGTSLLYVGGMFLNDAFDADFDRKHRSKRPIPSGAASETEVWLWGSGLITVGGLSLVLGDGRTTLLTVALIGAILLYDAVHKMTALAPVLMALCRFLLVLVSAAGASAGVDRLILGCAFVLGLYVAGVSYVARGESTGGIPRFWPLLLLVSPVWLALLAHPDAIVARVLPLSLLLVAWIFQSLRHLYWRRPRRIERAVSELLAGIVLVDLLAVRGGTLPIAAAFAAFFVAALLLQRSIPAT